MNCGATKVNHRDTGTQSAVTLTTKTPSLQEPRRSLVLLVSWSLGGEIAHLCLCVAVSLWFIPGVLVSWW